MSDNFLISVIIPTYNRVNELIRCIRSVQQQTYPIHEILICDDGSTDHSFQMISEIKDPKIQWIDCGRNFGAAIPRNFGIRASTGNWIAFLDSDDEWVETKIEEQINLIKTTNCKAISTNAIRICNEKEDGLYLNYSKQNIKILNILWNNPIILSSTMISKLALISTDLFPEEQKYKAIEDYVLWLKILTNTNFIFLNTPLIKYYDAPTLSIRSESKSSFYPQRKLATLELIRWADEKTVKLNFFIKIFIFLCNSWIVEKKYQYLKRIKFV